MAKLIIIFAGAQGKAGRRNRRSNSDDRLQRAVAGGPGSGSAVLAASDGDQRAISRRTGGTAGGGAEGIAGSGGWARCGLGACGVGGRGDGGDAAGGGAGGGARRWMGRRSVDDDSDRTGFGARAVRCRSGVLLSARYGLGGEGLSQGPAARDAGFAGERIVAADVGGV